MLRPLHRVLFHLMINKCDAFSHRVNSVNAVTRFIIPLIESDILHFNIPIKVKSNRVQSGIYYARIFRCFSSLLQIAASSFAFVFRAEVT